MTLTIVLLCIFAVIFLVGLGLALASGDAHEPHTPAVGWIIGCLLALLLLVAVWMAGYRAYESGFRTVADRSASGGAP